MENTTNELTSGDFNSTVISNVTHPQLLTTSHLFQVTNETGVSTTTASANNSHPSSPSDIDGVVIGSIVGGIFVLLLISLLVIYFVKRRKPKKRKYKFRPKRQISTMSQVSGTYESVGPALPARPPEMLKVTDAAIDGVTTRSNEHYIIPETFPTKEASEPKQQGEEEKSLQRSPDDKPNPYLQPLPCPGRDEGYITLDGEIQTNCNEKETIAALGEPPPTALESIFPCRDPKYPELKSLERRIKTFTDSQCWQGHRLRACVEDICSAGWYYLGRGDEMSCWYCGQCTRYWEKNDEPWKEHAKWSPRCEYLLQSKGSEYVCQIQSQMKPSMNTVV